MIRHWTVWPWLPRCGLTERGWCSRLGRCPVKLGTGFNPPSNPTCRDLLDVVKVGTRQLSFADWGMTVWSSKAGARGV